MKHDDQLCAPFAVERGPRQGSVLSPTLFNLVIDPLLYKDKNMGLSINGLFPGAFGHADDIRTISTNPSDMKDPFNSGNTYINSRGLNLCIEKCGTVVSWHLLTAENSPLLVEEAVKCLGVWYHNSTNKTSICDRINKARAAFSAHGDLGTFHGKLTLSPRDD